MLNKRLPFLAVLAVGAMGLSACAEKPAECISAEGPFVVQDQTYDKLNDEAAALPRCEEKKPEEVLDGAAESGPEGPGPEGPDSPGQPDTPGEGGPGSSGSSDSPGSPGNPGT